MEGVDRVLAGEEAGLEFGEGPFGSFGRRGGKAPPRAGGDQVGSFGMVGSLVREKTQTAPG